MSTKGSCLGPMPDLFGEYRPCRPFCATCAIRLRWPSRRPGVAELQRSPRAARSAA
jgi:hypothetical protein